LKTIDTQISRCILRLLLPGQVVDCNVSTTTTMMIPQPPFVASQRLRLRPPNERIPPPSKPINYCQLTSSSCAAYLLCSLSNTNEHLYERDFPCFCWNGVFREYESCNLFFYSALRFSFQVLNDVIYCSFAYEKSIWTIYHLHLITLFLIFFLLIFFLPISSISQFSFPIFVLCFDVPLRCSVCFTTSSVEHGTFFFSFLYGGDITGIFRC